MTSIYQWLVNPGTLLYLLNLALAVSGVCAVGLMAAGALRRRSAPLRHALLVAALALIAVAPALVWLARQSGSGLLRISMSESTPRDRDGQTFVGLDSLTTEAGALDALRSEKRSKAGVGVGEASLNKPKRSDRPAPSKASPPVLQVAAAGAGDQNVAAVETGKSAVNHSPSAAAGLPSRETVPLDRPNAAPGVAASTWWLIAGSIIASIWAAGIAVGTTHLLVGFGRLGRLRRSLIEPAPPGLQQLAREAAGRVGLGSLPKIYISPFVPTPISLGLFRAVIVLPESFQDELSGKQLDAILVHEAAHLARHDQWAALLGRVVTTLYWWNPLVHLLVGRLSAAREEVCDNYVIESQGDGRPFAKALVESAARMTAAMRLPAAVGILDSNPHGLRHRVYRLLDSNRETATRPSLAARLAVVAFAVAVATGLMITNVRADKESEAVKRAVGQLRRAAEARERAAENLESAAEDRERAAEELLAAKEQPDGRAVQTLLEVAESLAKLGTFADLASASYDQPAPTAKFGAMAHKLDLLPALERYQLLRRWTLPADDRRSVRLLSNFVPTDGPPAEFGGMDYRPVAVKGVLSSVDLLLQAARETDKLDELADELLDAADAGVENAEALWILVEIARDNSAEVRWLIEQNVATLPQKLQDARQGSQFQPMEWTDFLIARACLDNADLHSLGESYARTLAMYPQRWSSLNDSFVTHVVQDLVATSLAEGSDAGQGAYPGLALWNPVNDMNSISHRIGWVPAYWLEHDGEIEHRIGPQYNYLYFKYPVTGTFEFSVDCYFVRPSIPFAFTPSVYSSVSYGGLVSDRSMIWVVGTQDRFYPQSPIPVEKGFLRVSVQAEPGRIRFLHNGKLYYEESPASPASPWLALNGVRAHQARFRNLQLTGDPVIPPEVRLTHENRLEGWISSYYFETQPRQPRNAQRRRNLNIMPSARAEHADWYAEEGVIHGRRRTGRTPANQVESVLGYQRSEVEKFDRMWQQRKLPVQGRLYYNRPLYDGDTLSYEFFYEPDATLVHPSLGQVAFLLEPERVRLHWITDTPFDDPTGLSHDNVIDVPHERRGPEQLPLKPGEWNTLAVSLTGETATLTLNDVAIYERSLDPRNNRIFGLFHWKDRTAVQVRNVVLRGDWPETLSPEIMANLLASSGTVEGPNP